MAVLYPSLGSNIGNRAANISRALDEQPSGRAEALHVADVVGPHGI